MSIMRSERNEDREGLGPEVEGEIRELVRRDLPQLRKSQSEFALMIGVSVSTLQNWEQGRRQPDGPARALLTVAAKNPEVVAAALAE